MPSDGPRRCPSCDQSFAGSWGGIDAHWRSHHENERPYREFWDSLCEGHRRGGDAADDFAAITRAGHQARQAMTSSGTDDAFVDLLCAHPRDGMLYFLRGQAFERLGDRRRALVDFALAEHLFPMDRWKREAAAAKARVADAAPRRGRPS